MGKLSIESESKLTDRYQTTVPEPVRRALHLKKRDKIHYSVQADGTVILTRVKENKPDPVIDQFLTFLAQDLQKHPENLKAIDPDLIGRIQSLVKDVKIDLNEKLSDEDE